MRPKLDPDDHVKFQFTASSERNVRFLLERLAQSADPVHSSARFAVNRVLPDGYVQVIAFLMQRQSVASVDIALLGMIVQNGKAHLLPEGHRLVELIAAAISLIRPICLRRKFLIDLHKHVPCSLLQALKRFLVAHPWSEENITIYNPYLRLGEDLPPGAYNGVSRLEISELLAGLASDDNRVHRVFLAMMETISFDLRNSESALCSHLAQELKLRQSVFSSIRLRARYYRLIGNLGDYPSAEELVTLLSTIVWTHDKDTAEVLLDTLSYLDIPTGLRPVALEALFQTARSFPSLARQTLLCLEKAAPQEFHYSPVLGSDGLLAFIDLYRLNHAAESPLKGGEVRNVIHQIYEHLRSFAGATTLERQFTTEIFDQCIRIAAEHGLYYELYNFFVYEGFLRSIPPFVSFDGPPTFDTIPKGYLPIKTIEYFKGASDHQSIEISIGLFESAAHVARRHCLGSDQLLRALTAQADLACRGGHYYLAEELYAECRERSSGNPPQEADQAHYYSLFLRNSMRWYKAIIVAKALRHSLERREPSLRRVGPMHEKRAFWWSRQLDWLTRTTYKRTLPQTLHYMLDTILHEAVCRRQLREYDLALQNAQLAADLYMQYPFQRHREEALFNIGACQVANGDMEAAEATFRELETCLANRGDVNNLRASILSRKAAACFGQGDLARAEGMLRNALELRRFDSFADKPSYGSFAEDCWLLGHVRIAQGNLDGARDAFIWIRRHASGFVEQCYAERLGAALDVQLGSLDRALASLQRFIDRFDGEHFPDLQVEVCLECHRRLIITGWHDRALAAASKALQIALRADHPWAVGEAQLARIGTFIDKADFSEARKLCVELLGREQFSRPVDIQQSAALYLVLLDLMQAAPVEQSAPYSSTTIWASLHSGVKRTDFAIRFARACLNVGNVSLAQQWLEKAETQIKPGMEWDVVLSIRMLRGTVFRAIDEKERAAIEFQEAVRIFELLHSSAELIGIKTQLWGRQEGPYEALIDVLLELGKNEIALSFVERSKSRFLLAQMHWQVSAEFATDARLTRYTELLRRLAIMDLASDNKLLGDKPAEWYELNQQLDMIRESLDENELGLAVFPQFVAPEQLGKEILS
jgi:tetratricopeptide (TPR) repeat protein